MTRDMTEPIGAIYVHRRKTGDEAWIKEEDGWKSTKPPDRKPETQDGSAEYWEPLRTTPPHET